MGIHEQNVKECRYYSNGDVCPYNEVGCKFKHADDEIHEVENDLQTSDNLCYYCNTMFENQEDLVVHMTNMHIAHGLVRRLPARRLSDVKRSKPGSLICPLLGLVKMQLRSYFG